MITSVANENCFEFRGLSTDTKPFGTNVVNKNVNFPVSNGSVFFEIDTGDVYMLKIIANGDGTFTGEWTLI